MILHSRFFIKKWMIVMCTSLMFMGIVNAYPVAVPGGRDPDPEVYDYYGPFQTGCSVDDPTLSIRPRMSNDRESGFTSCLPGGYCSYVCKSGYLPNKAYTNTNYNSKGVSVGKVLCNSQGKLDLTLGAPLCVRSPQNIYLTSLLSFPSSFCQKLNVDGRVLLAPNIVQPKLLSSIAVSNNKHQDSSLYYFNTPGVGSEYGCLAGPSMNGVGVLSPYILEVTRDAKDHVVLRLGWNPSYVFNERFKSVLPNWGLKILCQGVDCSQSCYIDPGRHGVNECENCVQDYSGASFCTVKVPQNMEAVVFLFPGDTNKNIKLLDKFSFESSTDKLSVIQKNEKTVLKNTRLTTGHEDSADDKKLGGKKKTQDEELKKGYDLEEEEERLAQKEKDVLEENLQLQQNSLYEEGDKQFQQKESSQHQVNQQSSMELAKESKHEDVFLKHSPLDNGKSDESVDLVYLKISGADGKGLEEFKGFLDRKEALFTKESTTNAHVSNDASKSTSLETDSSRNNKCKTLLEVITNSASKLCSLLKSEESENPALYKLSNEPDPPRGDSISMKKENSAADILKSNTHWVFIVMAIMTFL